MPEPLWKPSPEAVAGSNMVAFTRAAEMEWGIDLPDYESLFNWSVEAPEQFWSTMWSFGRIVASDRGNTVLADGDRMPGARWFPEARLNFAENLLRRRDDGVAIIFSGEGKVRRQLSFRALYSQVSRTAQAMRAAGLESGDRVAAMMPNMPETVICMLAASSIGAIWSSCSPDFGVDGVLDRFGQIKPTIFITAEGYYYNAKTYDCREKLRPILDELPSVKKVVMVSYARSAVHMVNDSRAVTLSSFVDPYQPRDIPFEQLPFDHPLYIMFSSGTTGKPKCIVHGAGGTLIQHLKEHLLHCDIKRDDRVFYFTTCGWMMWNWLVSALACEAALLLYDGSPFAGRRSALFDFADETGMTLFGTSAKYIDAAKKAGLEPARTHRLENLRVITSTGSPLVPESFEYVYAKVKKDVCLASISGGTDIISCFVLGNPAAPVYSGEIQTRGLGMQVEVFDDEGRSVQGAKGELVCTAPFPSMPTGFWNDPDGARYRAAYFERFENTWCHGDYVELTDRGGMIIYGRSDAVLNPGGVRIGTAEIYRQVEQLDEVEEGLAVGQQWKGDTRVILFVKLKQGVVLDTELTERIRRHIRTNTTPRHVPEKVVQVGDIPRTKSGKITELAVTDVIHGRPVKNKEALANPEALDLYADLEELQN
jgi:acetoacetyl-CoA synthetase